MVSPAADEKCAVVAVNSTDAVEIASLFPADNGTGATVNNKTLFVNVVSFF
jgi:hypothetical protein